MGSHRVVLPEAKFSGQEDVREFLRDFGIYVAVNEWTDEKAGQYLAVYLKDDAKAFYHQQPETVRKSFSELSNALKQRYEGGLALLKYKRDFNSRSRKEGEPLHSYLADLRLAYDKAYAPPTVDELPAEPSAALKKKNNEQIGALAYYEARKAEDVLCQFVNGLKKGLREVLIRQDDLLTTPVETVVKRIATLEEESGGVLKVASVSESIGGYNPTGSINKPGEIEEIVSRTVEQKLEQLAGSSQGPLSAAVRRGGKRTGRWRPGPRPTDVCRACKGRGHWARSCPTLNESGAGQGPRFQP